MSTDKTLYDIFKLNHVINKVFFKGFEEQFQPENINFTQIKTMVTLKFDGPCSMSYVSGKLGLEKGSFSSVAHHLIDIGYVNKIQDSKDKRVFLLELTPKGREVTKEIIQKHCLFIKEQIDKFSDIEKDTYYSAVKLIISMTEKLM